MITYNSNSFNHQVFQKSYKRLNLSSTNRIIFQRLLGFLIRNNKPFPYSAIKLSELTGFSLRTIFNGLNELERCRLIKRIGMGKNRKFISGSILNRIFTTVQNRTKLNLKNNSTTVQLMHQKSINRATGAYNKTYSSLKHKEDVIQESKSKPQSFTKNQLEYNEYAKQIATDKLLNIKGRLWDPLPFDEWLAQKN